MPPYHLDPPQPPLLLLQSIPGTCPNILLFAFYLPPRHNSKKLFKWQRGEIWSLLENQCVRRGENGPSFLSSAAHPRARAPLLFSSPQPFPNSLCGPGHAGFARGGRTAAHRLPPRPRSPRSLLLTRCRMQPGGFLLFQNRCISLQNSAGAMLAADSGLSR